MMMLLVKQTVTTVSPTVTDRMELQWYLHLYSHSRYTVQRQREDRLMKSITVVKRTKLNVLTQTAAGVMTYKLIITAFKAN